MNMVEIYTDGACRGNPGPGGWGVLLIYNQQQKELKGAEAETTNNRMELMASIQALRALNRRCEVKLYTDSQYVRKGITEWMENWQKKNWRTANKQPVKNADLWKQLNELSKQHDIKWIWVKGHSGNEGNERADGLANEAIDEML